MSQRLRKQQRLLTATDYRRVFKDTAVRAGRAELLMLARPGTLPHHRLGLAVAKKHVPQAVKRNLIKRIVRERFRRLGQAQVPLDIVILSRPAARDADRHQLSRAIEQLFQRVGMERGKI